MTILSKKKIKVSIIIALVVIFIWGASGRLPSEFAIGPFKYPLSDEAKRSEKQLDVKDSPCSVNTINQSGGSNAVDCGPKMMILDHHQQEENGTTILYVTFGNPPMEGAPYIARPTNLTEIEPAVFQGGGTRTYAGKPAVPIATYRFHYRAVPPTDESSIEFAFK